MKLRIAAQVSLAVVLFIITIGATWQNSPSVKKTLKEQSSSAFPTKTPADALRASLDAPQKTKPAIPMNTSTTSTTTTQPSTLVTTQQQTKSTVPLPTTTAPVIPTTTMPQQPTQTTTQPQLSTNGGWHQVAICEEGGSNNYTYGYLGINPQSWGGYAGVSTAGQTDWDTQVVRANQINGGPPWCPVNCAAGGYRGW